MISFKTNWNVSTAVCAACALCSTSVVARAQTPDSVRGYLIDGTKWSSAEGDVYIFRSDGHFEFRCGPGMLRAHTFARDYGRFRVRPARKSDIGKDKFILELFTSSSLRNKRFRKGGSAYVQRTAYQTLPIRFAKSTKYAHASDAIIYETRFSSKAVAGF